MAAVAGLIRQMGEKGAVVPYTRGQIEDLAGYRGSTPVPPDFDEFWATRIQEADSEPLEWELVPATEAMGGANISPEAIAGASCKLYDLWFRGMGGARLHAKYLVPKGELALSQAHEGEPFEGMPLVLQFHGYPGTSRSWLEQMSYVGMGMAILAFDCPGQGGPGNDVGGYEGTTVSGHIVAGLDGDPAGLYYVRCHQDIRILCRIIRELEGIDLSRVYVNGASQGGGLGIACAALNADLVSRAAILYPFLSDYRRVFELEADDIAYEGLRYYARWFDPAGERTGEVFGKLAYIDSVSFAHLVRCEVLFGTGLADIVCPPPTQCAVYNNLDCPKRRVLFPDFGHEEIRAFDDMIIDFFNAGLRGGERDE